MKFLDSPLDKLIYFVGVLMDSIMCKCIANDGTFIIVLWKLNVLDNWNVVALRFTISYMNSETNKNCLQQKSLVVYMEGYK